MPEPRLVTRRLLVMSFLEGASLSRVEELRGKASGVALLVRRRMARNILSKVAQAWGFMFFKSDVFHAVSEFPARNLPLLSPPSRLKPICHVKCLCCI